MVRPRESGSRRCGTGLIWSEARSTYTRRAATPWFVARSTSRRLRLVVEAPREVEGRAYRYVSRHLRLQVSSNGCTNHRGPSRYRTVCSELDPLLAPLAI